MKQLAFFFDADKCSGCKVCAAACKDKKNLAAGRKFRKVYHLTTGEWKLVNGAYEHQKVGGYNLSVACMHCEKPACMEVCPANAIGKREDGIVYIDQERCIGCESCAYECPYHAPSLDAEIGKMNKCDFCRDSLAENETPACVGACMERALHYGEYSELIKKFGKNQQISPLASPDRTNPSIVLKAHRNYSGKNGMTEVSFTDEIQPYEQ
jgi:anaerobic dimethyl sulfoxide reductase subunit B (iron-sulfur subunit)